MTEHDIYLDTALRLWNLSSMFLDKTLADPNMLKDEIDRVSQLPLATDLRGKIAEELSEQQAHFAKMLYYARLVREDPRKAEAFAIQSGLVSLE